MGELSPKPNQAPLPPELALNRELAELVSEYGLDPTLADLFAADSGEIHQYNETGDRFHSYLVEQKLESAQGLKTALEVVYRRDPSEEKIDAQPREVRRTLHSPDSARRMGAAVMNAFLATEAGRDWAAAIDELTDRDGGLAEASELVQAIALVNVINYSGQAGADYTEPVQDDDQTMLFEQMGFDSADFESPPSISDLTAWLHEKGLLDLSKEMLDVRVERFAATVQIEVARLFLGGLIHTKILMAGRFPKQARWLAARYKDALLIDDYDLKIEMMDALGEMYQDFAEREKDRTTQEFMDDLAEWSFQTGDDIDEYLGNFKAVYEALGFELHPLLRPDDINEETMLPKLSLLETGTTQSESKPDAALRGEFDTRVTQLYERATKLAKIWRMNAHERRNQGFSTMYRELVGGFKNFAGRQLLDRMDKRDAQAYIDIVSHLHDLCDAQDPQQLFGRQALVDALTDQAAIRNDIRLLERYARDLGISVTWPPITPIEEVVGEVRENWETFRQIALKTWPGQGGVVVVQQLEQLLFDSPPLMEDDQLTREAVVRQLEVAELLDMIVLPPDASQEDLRHVLQNAGVDRLPVSAFEWRRLENLIALREQFGGRLYRTKDRRKGKEDMPAGQQSETEQAQEPKIVRAKKTRAIEDDDSFWVLIFDFDGDSFVIAESAFTDHATFVVCDRLLAESTALEVLGLGRREAPSHGAHRVTHHQGKLTHPQRVQNKVLELHYAEAA